MTRSPQHARGASQREATVNRDPTGRREKADAAMLAVRLAIILWELIVDHVSGGGLRRIF